MSKIIPIILAGGTGSRLWPLSRESFPKQFLQLSDEDNYTLIQKTFKRVENLENIFKPIIICNEEHRFIVGDQMRQIKVDPLCVLTAARAPQDTLIKLSCHLKIMNRNRKMKWRELHG